jgi:hypothetical protein
MHSSTESPDTVVGQIAQEVVHSVLMSIVSNFPALGVRGGEVGDEDKVSVSAALTILESHVCICEREIWDAPSARPPGALNT